MDTFVTLEHLSYTIRLNTKLQVGRANDCDIRLDRDSRVSRHHCLLTNQNNIVTIVDLGSKHGTKVDDVQVHDTPVTLSEGAVIQIGTTKLVFHVFDDGVDEPDTRVG